jgi:hypothetical protein
MDLICYLQSNWAPMIRPAEATRDWMDRSKLSYAYRCLPLNIANAHGWEILNPVAFDAIWNGGSERADIILDVPPDTPSGAAPVSIFGEAILTFHINGLFRTPPGWNLWVGGSPNSPKDAIYPLAGVIETDWSPYTFTMNWRFTRRNRRVHFDVGEPICFVFPVQRSLLGTVRPRFVPIEADPQLALHHTTWSQSRDDFNKKLEQANTLTMPAVDRWQKRYFRGIDMTDQPVEPDHRTKLRLAPFASVEEGASPADPNAPVTLQTDTATLGRAFAEFSAAIRTGALESDQARQALARRLGAIGLGESEAVEVIWAAMDSAESDALRDAREVAGTDADGAGTDADATATTSPAATRGSPQA